MVGPQCDRALRIHGDDLATREGGLGLLQWAAVAGAARDGDLAGALQRATDERDSEQLGLREEPRPPPPPDDGERRRERVEVRDVGGRNDRRALRRDVLEVLEPPREPELRQRKPDGRADVVPGLRG
jgi:hypothetical protein